jgi:outer membrane protein OmpA-like peptidoglycan-associated protein
MRGTIVAMALGLASVSPGQAQTDLQASTVDLVFASLDLVFAVEDMEGAVQSLEIEETATEIRIELSADVLFDFDSAALRPEAEAALQNVAGIIREHEGAHVRVEGHTDAKGSEDYNQRLSEQRAESVRDWLTSADGLSGTDFEITGFGESKPAAPNEKPDGADDPEGRQKNRRVEIVVSKE